MIRPKECFERVYEELIAMKEDLDGTKEVAIAEALAKVDEVFAERQLEIENALAAIPVIEEADEVEESEEAYELDESEEAVVEEEEVEQLDENQPSEEVVIEEIVEG